MSTISTQEQKSPSKWKVEQAIGNDWEDADWTGDDGAPLRFDSETEAEEAIKELIEGLDKAMGKGDIVVGQDPAEFRVVPDFS